MKILNELLTLLEAKATDITKMLVDFADRNNTFDLGKELSSIITSARDGEDVVDRLVAFADKNNKTLPLKLRQAVTLARKSSKLNEDVAGKSFYEFDYHEHDPKFDDLTKLVAELKPKGISVARQGRGKNGCKVIRLVADRKTLENYLSKEWANGRDAVDEIEDY